MICMNIVNLVQNQGDDPIFVRCFQQRGDGEAHANIIRQICEMFSALPLTFCALPPITHRQQQQAKADLPNGLPHTPEILLMLMLVLVLMKVSKTILLKL